MSTKTITDKIVISDPKAVKKFNDILSKGPQQEIKPTSKEDKEAAEEFVRKWSSRFH